MTKAMAAMLVSLTKEVFINFFCTGGANIAAICDIKCKHFIFITRNLKISNNGLLWLQMAWPDSQMIPILSPLPV